MKKILIIAAICVCVAAVILAWCNALFYVPRPDNAKGMRQLKETVGTAQPLIDALEKYRHDHGCYPSTVKLLYPAYLSTRPTMFYSVDPTAPKPQEYHLFVCWRDPCLRYDHRAKASDWTYDPGTGDASTSLPF